MLPNMEAARLTPPDDKAVSTQPASPQPKFLETAAPQDNKRDEPTAGPACWPFRKETCDQSGKRPNHAHPLGDQLART